jgi:hypothetical protein
MKKLIVTTTIFLIFITSLVIVPAISTAASQFTVTAQEQGLPSNTLWTGYITNHTIIDSISTTGIAESFALPNGTYQYQFNNTTSYYPLSSTGYFTVSNGTYTLTVQYVPKSATIKYNETFIPQKLPSTNTTWTLFINDQTYNTNTSITISLLPGNYTFSATAIGGYIVNTSYVFVTKNESFNVTFYKPQYTGLSATLNAMFLTIGITLDDFYVAVVITIGIVLGYLLYRFSKNEELFPVPLLVITLVTYILTILPLYLFVILLFVTLAGEGISIIRESKENVGDFNVD